MLYAAGWITGDQFDTGLIFADLWKREDRHIVQLRNEVLHDLMKIDALDLLCRVCRDNNIRPAFDRIPRLRQGLDLVALRFKQIENAAAQIDYRRKPNRRAAGAADTVSD